MVVIGIYHKKCNDGTAAAAVLLRKFPDAKLFPLGHGYEEEDIAPIHEAAAEGDDIYTVDCALGAEEFLRADYEVTTLDHHISAKPELERLAREYPHYSFTFDNEKSGASLAWAHFFPDEPVPELIKYVEDVDIWKREYGEDSKDVSNYLGMFHDSPEEVLVMLKGDITELKRKGNIISAYVDHEIEHRLESAAPLTVTIGGHAVPAYNITGYQSALGHELAKHNDRAVALFSIKGEEVRCSIRSLDHHTPSALDLASALGGGGHKNAAGAAIPLKDFFQMIVFEM